MVSGHACQKCSRKESSNSMSIMCSSCDTCTLEGAMHPTEYKLSSDILIVKHASRKHLKSPTHFCKMCGYGDFSSTRVRRHLMLKHLHLGTTKPIELCMEKPSILADRLSANRNSDSEPESPLTQKMTEDLPEDLSMHSDAVSDNDENVQVVPQFKPVPAIRQTENKRSVIVRPPKKTTAGRKSAAPAPAPYSILKRRLLGDQLVEEMEASEATLNSNELNVKMVYQNSKFVIDKSESFWLKGYKLPARYELASQ